MKYSKWFNSRTTIIVAGVLLAAYLLLILGVANLGQGRLKESQNNALYLKILNYADNLSFYFDVAKEDVEHLANNSAMTVYFSNRVAGMSLQYGLGTSLFNLKHQLNNLLNHNKVESHRLFRQLAVISLTGNIIADTQGFKLDNVEQLIQQLQPNATDVKIFTLKDGDNPSIYLVKNIFFNNNLVAKLIAKINNKVLIHQLTSQEYRNTRSYLKLVTQSSDILVWNSLDKTPKDQLSFFSRFFRSTTDLIYYQVGISGTPFKLDGWFNPVTQRDIFTSAWFIAAISLLAFPVLWGLFYLLKINNANLILKTQIDVSTQQHKKLALKNELLQNEIQKRKFSEKKLAYQANHDELTGLSNRIYSLRRLDSAINHSKINDSHVLVMFLDLDNFKHVNDTLGHHAGDLLLKQIATRLKAKVRGFDTVARFGGDEFLIVIPNIINRLTAEHRANSILNLFEQAFNVELQQIYISTSIGIALYPFDGDTAEALIKSADTALYQKKESGRNGFSFYHSNMIQNVQRKMALNARLYQAIAQQQIHVYYQPIYDLVTQKIVAAEALLRWRDDELGVISPDEFIPIAEQSGLIHKIGDFVLKQACSQAQAWQVISPISIAVNFSSLQFRQCTVIQNKIISVLTETGLPANKLCIEVTESLLLEPDDTLAYTIEHLKNLGIECSIDDFGTGYSSLSYLQKFAFSTLKIDRSFIGQISSNKTNGALVSAIIAMAKSLKLKVVAEGVEDEKQAQFLIQQGCKLGQGYLFSPPIPAIEFSELLLSEQTTEVKALA